MPLSGDYVLHDRSGQERQEGRLPVHCHEKGMNKVILYTMPAPYLTRCAVTLYPGDGITCTQTMPEAPFEHIFSDPSSGDPFPDQVRGGTGYGRC